MSDSALDRDNQWQALTMVAVSTVVLTAGFVGLLALLSGKVTDPAGRLPWYVLAMGLAFVASILYLAHQGSDAETTLIASTVLAFLTLLWSFLAVEGVLYAVSSPQEVFRSRLLVYLLAAGLIATGLTIWLLEYWRSFAGGQ